MPHVRSTLLVAAALVAAPTVHHAPVLSAGQTASPTVSPSLYSGLKWRHIGPFRGGRVNAVTGVPGQPTVFYFGSVGGGVWKSTNAGRNWSPIFDSQPVGSIGAIAVAPSRPETIYVGTGEADMRSQIAYGNGMYKSTDAGETWTHIGLDDTKQIGRIVVDPKNPDVVLVAALGHAYGPNPDRGVFRSRDGGRTWQKVLFKDENVGAIDLVFDPRTSQTVYAALWNTRRPPWSIYPPSYGPGSGIYRSTDGGTTWTQLTQGLPAERVGRIGLATAPTNGNRVYAIIDAKEGGMYRSDDAGVTWQKMTGDQRIWGRGWYFCKTTVDPKNASIVYVGNTSLYRSTDGGKTFVPIKGAPGGDDYQGLWIAPEDPRRMIAASDQGAVVSVDGARTWSSWYNQPTAQLYHVNADYRFPYWVTGAQQDSGAVSVPSRTHLSVISFHDWRPTCAGGEAGYTAADPLHPEILFGGTVTKCNVLTGETRNVTPERDMPEPARHTWTVPLVFSAADSHALYYSNQFLYKTTDGGEHWVRISPDLTREDPGVPGNLDEATAADAPKETRRGVIYTIAPSPVDAATVWVGTDDGLIHLTRDDGKTWQNVTPPGLAPWSKVSMLDASHFDVNEAYAAVDRHRLEDYTPHVYRTRDGGKTWQEISVGLPPAGHVNTVKEDTLRRGLLFAGTELAMFVSFDDGDHWQSLQLNLPAVSMRDIAIKNDDVIVATHGRGFWVLDGIGALRQINDEVASAGAWLFKPSDAYRLPPPSEQGTPLPNDEPFAENPPYGAFIDYFLGANASGPASIEILDSSGQLVRKYSSDDPVKPPDPSTLNIPEYWVPKPVRLSTEAGMHRWVWDLRPTPSPDAGRGGPGGGVFGSRTAAVSAGVYTVRLTAGGRTLTQTLTLKPDPRAMP